jgi:hypothetical protein
MQYNGPLDQPANPNASYNNGIPAAGIPGSIPPAPAIEFPQREIVAAITAAGLAPSNGDLTQLTEAIKLVDVCNVFKISGNGGSASGWIGVIPALPAAGGAPPIGTMCWFQPGTPSVGGGTTFQLNGYAAAPVTLSDRSALLQGDVPSGSTWCLLFWDGTEWQLLAGSSRLPGGLGVLEADANWYVNASTGSDTLYDGTSATVVAGTAHGPFQTIQRAANQTLLFNMNGHNQFIHVADGSYGPAIFYPTNGSGAVNVIGDTATPANCAVTATAEYASAFLQLGGTYLYNGFRLACASNGSAGFALNGGAAQLDNLQFGPCGLAHISSSWNGQIALDSATTFTIEAGANSQFHILAVASTTIRIPTTPQNPPNLVIQGAVTFSNAFIAASTNALAEVIYTTITGGSNVAGAKYVVNTNANIASFGSGTSYYPGSTGGSTATGGQYT